MRVVLAVLLALAVGTLAHPQTSCASFTCTDGWYAKTNVAAQNIACLNGVCTNRVCCNPPTCAQTTSLGCVLKANAPAIQCPGQTLSGCTSTVCCARIQPPPTCKDYSVYFANYLGDNRVNKMRLNFNVITGEVTLVNNSIAVVAAPGGGDGIIVNPQDSTQLFVGGQNDRLFVVDTTNPNPATNWWRQIADGTRVYHVIAVDNNRIVGSHVDGWGNVSVFTLVGGTLPDQGHASVIPVTGASDKVVSIIVAGGRLVYTTSTEAGEPGNVGLATLSATSLNTAAPFLTDVRAHAGVYQASSDSLFVWGQRQISQYSLAGVLKSQRDLTDLIGTAGTAGARHVDNGVLHADRWLLIVSNSGKLLWFDLTTGPIATAQAGSFTVTNSDGLDAITIPVCNLA